MANINMFNTTVLNKVLGYDDRTHVIIQNHRNWRNPIFRKHLFHQQQLSTTTISCNIFCLCYRERYTVLFLVEPYNQIIWLKKTSTWSTLAIFRTPCLICIRVPNNIEVVSKDYHRLYSIVPRMYFQILSA